MSKITQYGALASPASDDVLPIVDVHDQTMATSGTTKRITVAGLLAETVATSQLGAADGVAQLDGAALLPKASLPNVARSDYKFTPEDHAGAADAVLVSDGVMTSGSAVLACTTSTPFASSSAGKAIYVVGAGSGGAILYTTIAGYSNSGHVTLSATASTAVSGAGVAFGTDNTTAIRAALSDAWTFMAGSSREAALLLLGGGYGAAGSPVLGGATLGNAMFPLAPVAATGRKWRLRLQTGSDAAALLHWQQEVPQPNGSGIVVLNGNQSADATYGPPSVFGGPYDGYGASASLFSNMAVTVDGMAVLAPWDSGWSGFDFLGMAQANALNWGVLAAATVPSGTGWPQITNYGALTRTTCGLRMPDCNNNDRCYAGDWSVEGLVYGLMPSEHTNWNDGHAIYTFVCVQVYSGSAMAHMVPGGRVSAEASTYAVGVMPTGITGFPGGEAVKVALIEVDLEGTTLLNDTGNLMTGTIVAGGNYSPGWDQLAVNGGAGVRVIDALRVRGPLSSPQAPPSSASAWQNLYNGDAEVTLSVSGGTISALTITSTGGSNVTQPVPSGATSYRFRLPSRLSYTPTYTGTASHAITVD